MITISPLHTLAPFPGEVWQSKKPRRTRHVMDRSLGAHVFYIEGRHSRYAPQQRCSIEEWRKWVTNAKLIRVDEMAP